MSSYQLLAKEEAELLQEAKRISKRLQEIDKSMMSQFEKAEKYADIYTETRCVGCGFLHNRYRLQRLRDRNFTIYRHKCGHIICNNCVGYYRYQCLKCNSDTIKKLPRNYNKVWYTDKSDESEYDSEANSDNNNETDNRSDSESDSDDKQAKKKQKL